MARTPRTARDDATAVRCELFVISADRAFCNAGLALPNSRLPWPSATRVPLAGSYFAAMNDFSCPRTTGMAFGERLPVCSPEIAPPATLALLPLTLASRLPFQLAHV